MLKQANQTWSLRWSIAMYWFYVSVVASYGAIFDQKAKSVVRKSEVEATCVVGFPNIVRSLIRHVCLASFLFMFLGICKTLTKQVMQSSVSA